MIEKRIFKIIDFLKVYTTFPLLITSFFATNTIMLVIFRLKSETETPHSFWNEFFIREFAENISTMFAVSIFISVTLVFMGMNRVFPKLIRMNPFFLFMSGLIYFTLAIHMTRPDTTFTLSAVAVMAAITIYMASKSGSLPGLPTVGLRIILVVLFAALTVFIGVATVFRYLTFNSPNYDFGIFSQMFEYMRTTGIPYTTCERDMLLSHFSVHVSPAFYLILPIYALFPSPITLQIVQAVIVASALFPLYLLCRHKKLPNTATLLVLVTFALYPALAGGTMFDIHENMFLTAFMMWLLYFIEKTDENEKMRIGVFIFALLTFAVKETTPIEVAVVALYVIIGKKKYKLGIELLALSIASFVLSLWLLSEFGNGVMAGSRLGVYADDGSMAGVIRAVLLNPSFVLNQMFTEEKIMYMVFMMLPLSLLPFISKKGANYILLIPCILMNIMPSWPYQYSITFHYNFGNCAIFFYLFVINYCNLDLKSYKLKKFVLVFSMAASLLLFTSEIWGRRDIVKTYNKNAETLALMRETMAEVPEDASVATSTFLLPHMYKNKILYDFDTAEKEAERGTEYIILDIRGGESRIPEIEEHGYYVKIKHDNVIVVMALNSVQ
ncbi:MAG: DUF2079 domain-containing protein [Oscillospiraceae bacterium]|nr:DUF2079 domain-containing protein [Oscillospiraceae bacterium]